MNELNKRTHIWLARPEDCPSELAWLDSHELSRHDRFSVVTAQHRFLRSHSFVRRVLSSYVPGLSESDWMFEFGPHGRPELAADLVVRYPKLEGLRFSLSHTDSLFAFLVARDIDCGVDVETATRTTDLIGVGKRSFAPSEFDLFEQLDGDDQRRRFFEYWTLKESYIKAIGTGLTTPLRNFWFEFDGLQVNSTIPVGGELARVEPEKISVTFAELHNDDSERWTFGLHRPTQQHQLAWAVADPPKPVLVKWLVA